MTYTPPEDEFHYHAQLWKAHDSIIDSCEREARRRGLDPELIENLKEADNFAEDSETWNRALADILQAFYPPRDSQ